MQSSTSKSNLQVVLASGSCYRAELLKRILPDFKAESADIDESSRPKEAPRQMAERLATTKAQTIAVRHPESLILGCDQVAILKNSEGPSAALGKPGNYETANAQLHSCSGKWVEFYVACYLLNTALNTSTTFSDSFKIRFRELTAEQIDRYLRREQPYDCAGSIKSEGLGIALIAAQKGSDPNTLIGLPLIKLVDELGKHGIAII